MVGLRSYMCRKVRLRLHWFVKVFPYASRFLQFMLGEHHKVRAVKICRHQCLVYRGVKLVGTIIITKNRQLVHGSAVIECQRREKTKIFLIHVILITCRDRVQPRLG